jgi:SAM-dependent methyltransferase
MKVISKAGRIEKFSSIVDRCQGKKVLDVGCVGQDRSSHSSDWLHGRIGKVAGSLLGVDINKEQMKVLNDQGCKIVLPEELEEINEKYDVIVMGDVIEHVNDPGAFLEFYLPYLNEGGTMIICTPNSFGVRYFLQVLIYGKPGTNDEHTLAFDPYVMLELFGRTGLVPVEFFWLQEYKARSNWKQSIILGVSAFFILLRKYFNSNFMFIVTKEKK